MISKISRILLLVFVILLTIVFSKVDIDFDPYKELGVAKHATQKEIKKAYKKLALRYHPDRSKDDSTTNKMSRINEAFAVIGDEKKRKEYDRQSHASRQGGFNIFRQTSRHKDDGLGILLTQDNSYNLLRKLNDHKPWLIFVCLFIFFFNILAQKKICNRHMKDIKVGIIKIQNKHVQYLRMHVQN